MFIVLEGLDGAGKSTQIGLLRDMFAAMGVESEYVHFPRFDAPVYGDLIARFLRGEFGGVDEVSPTLVALLFAGDRADMAPRISAGDLLLYYRLENSWLAQDVIVFEKEGRQYTDRIVAVGGDTVEVTDDAQLIINGSYVAETNIYYSTPPYDSGVTYPLTLQEDEVFVLCDYREGARDSRSFGPVKRSEIRGKVITIIRRSEL